MSDINLVDHLNANLGDLGPWIGIEDATWKCAGSSIAGPPFLQMTVWWSRTEALWWLRPVWTENGRRFETMISMKSIFTVALTVRWCYANRHALRSAIERERRQPSTISPHR